MATQQMNSRGWWDDYFDNQWSKNGGQSQTRGFMTTLICNLPDAELAYLRDGGQTILDWGCAMGDGVGLLGTTFPHATVTGLDFAERALETARRAYPQHTFIHTADGSIPSSFDVIVTSNCLEHFEFPLEVASRHLRSCRDLYIVLAPFNEQQPLLDQHMAQIREDTFPERLGGFTRLVSQPVDVSSLYWSGQELLVVYGSDQYLARRKSELTATELADVAKVRMRVLREDYLRISQGAVTAMQHDAELWRLAQEKDRAIDGLHARFDADLNLITQQRDAALSERDHLQVELESLHQRERQVRERAEAQEEQLDQYQRDLNLVYSTKAWRWTSAYWQLRQQGLKGYLLLFIRLLGMLLLSPFWLIYQIVRLVYHLLVPKPLRLWLWNWRWWMTHRAEVAALKPAGHHRRRSHGEAVAAHQYAKTGKHFFIFGTVPYYDIGGGQRSAQLAKTLNKMGYSVHYIFAVEASDAGERTADIPVVRHVALSDYSPKQLIADLMGEPVFIFEVPAPGFEPYLELAPTIGAKVIYEHIDNWETSLGSMLYSEPSYRMFLRQAEVVVATARPLQDKVLQFMADDPALANLTEKVIYLPNAVDTDLFDPAFKRELPTDLVLGDTTLLYYGSLWGEWFDWSLIVRLANECPRSSINLIGDYKPIEQLTKRLPKNVHFLGPKLQTELPAYLAYTDITLLPFKNDDIGKYVSPLKIFEYIAMNKRVLATALPDILDYPNVFASDSGDDWVAYVQRKPEVTPDDATSFAFASANNWYARCDSLLDVLGDVAPVDDATTGDNTKPSISVIVLNHNNRAVIGRCIESILHYSRRYDIEVIAVDNSSSDGSDVYIEQTFGDRIVFLRNSKNGCSSGRNLGVSHARGDYLLFIDSDQWAVSERWLDTPLRILQSHRNIGAVSWGAGWFSKGSYGGPIASYLPYGGVHPARYLRTDIAYVATSGMLMRRDVWNATEGFDEFYDPTVFEDTDLALQIKDMGFELAYTPYMNLMHLPHQTTKAGSEAHQRLMDRNAAYFGKKWKARNPKLLECYLH